MHATPQGSELMRSRWMSWIWGICAILAAFGAFATDPNSQAAGKAPFSAGAPGTVAGVTTPAAAGKAEALPSSVPTDFETIKSAAVGAGAAGAGGASTGATGTGATPGGDPSIIGTVIAVGFAGLAAAAANHSASNH
jgi:hypothetical protein